ncbi:MAG: type IV pilus assembly protein PilM [Coxiellaceae bacterium]|nr:type IV pilus assembly protein PilM [Coxiellaceae bacterium]
MTKFKWLKLSSGSKKNDNGPLVGIDVSSKYALLLELENKGSQYKLKQFASCKINDDSFNSETLVKPELLIEALNELRQQAQLKQACSAIATPAALTMSKLIRLDPKLTSSQQETAALHEAKQAFTQLSNDLMVDYEPLPGKESKKALLIAGRKSQITKRIEAFTKAKLPPIIVDIDYLALHRALSLIQNDFPKEWSEKPIAMTHINSRYILFIVVSNDQVTYHHHQHVEGTGLSSVIETAFNTESTPMPEENKTNELRKAVEQVQRQWQYYQAQQPQQPIAGLVLSGTLACVKESKDLLSESLGAEVIIADPLSKMAVSNALDTSSYELISPSTLLACGLAMRKKP